MLPNVLPSKLYPVAPTLGIAPQSIAAAGNATSSYVQVTPGARRLALTLLFGAGAGTAQVDVEQATSSGGAGSKALATGAIAAGATTTQDADVDLDLMDINNGFNFVRTKITITGGAGTLVALRAAFGPNPLAA
jgi:hypothetical protein